MSLHSACPCFATDSQASLCCSMVQLPDSVSLTVFGQGGCWEGLALTPGTAPLRMEVLTCYQAGNGTKQAVPQRFSPKYHLWPAQCMHLEAVPWLPRSAPAEQQSLQAAA